MVKSKKSTKSLHPSIYVYCIFIIYFVWFLFHFFSFCFIAFTYILICFISFSYGTFYAGLKRLVAKHFNSVKGGKNCGRAWGCKDLFCLVFNWYWIWVMMMIQSPSQHTQTQFSKMCLIYVKIPIKLIFGKIVIKKFFCFKLRVKSCV